MNKARNESEINDVKEFAFRIVKQSLNILSTGKFSINEIFKRNKEYIQLYRTVTDGRWKTHESEMMYVPVRPFHKTPRLYGKDGSPIRFCDVPGMDIERIRMYMEIAAKKMRINISNIHSVVNVYDFTFLLIVELFVRYISLRKGSFDFFAYVTVDDIVELCYDLAYDEDVTVKESNCEAFKVNKKWFKERGISNTYTMKNMCLYALNNYGIEERILFYMKFNPRISISEIAENLKKDIQVIKRAIKKMRGCKIERVGDRYTGYWKIIE